MCFPGDELVKNLPASAGDARDTGSIPGSGGSPGGGNGNLVQYSCLENPMDRGAWQATVHGAAKSRTRLSTHAQCGNVNPNLLTYPSPPSLLLTLSYFIFFFLHFRLYFCSLNKFIHIISWLRFQSLGADWYLQYDCQTILGSWRLSGIVDNFYTLLYFYSF